MDYVYANAEMSIGLCKVTLEQRHLDALLLVSERKIGSDIRRNGPIPLRRFRNLQLETVAEALSLIAADRWNTRAWILQEAFVTAGNMILLLPRAKEIAVDGWRLICLDLSLTEVAIKLDRLQSCIDELTAFLMLNPGSSVSAKIPKWAEAVERLAWVHPEPSGWHMSRVWLHSSKPRYTCNAAVALSFLKYRDNDRVADRLAILANLCDYSLRLNTWELEESQSRLSVCVLALSIANGDFSLLPPESYRVPRGLHISMFFEKVHTSRRAISLTAYSPEQRRQRVQLASF